MSHWNFNFENYEKTNKIRWRDILYREYFKRSTVFSECSWTCDNNPFLCGLSFLHMSHSYRATCYWGSVPEINSKENNQSNVVDYRWMNHWSYPFLISTSTNCNGTIVDASFFLYGLHNVSSKNELITFCKWWQFEIEYENVNCSFHRITQNSMEFLRMFKYQQFLIMIWVDWIFHIIIFRHCKQ